MRSFEDSLTGVLSKREEPIARGVGQPIEKGGCERMASGNRQVCRRPEPPSTGSDGECGGVTGDFNIVVGRSRVKIRTLHQCIIADPAAHLIVEDQFGDPAIDANAGSATSRTVHSDFWRSSH